MFCPLLDWRRKTGDHVTRLMNMRVRCCGSGRSEHVALGDSCCQLEPAWCHGNRAMATCASLQHRRQSPVLGGPLRCLPVFGVLLAQVVSLKSLIGQGVYTPCSEGLNWQLIEEREEKKNHKKKTQKPADTACGPFRGSVWWFTETPLAYSL